VNDSHAVLPMLIRPECYHFQHERLEHKSLWRPPRRSPRHGSVAVHSGVDARLLAGMGVPRRVRRLSVGNHLVPYEKGPKTLGAPDARRPSRRERDEPKDHTDPHGYNVHRDAGCPSA
jgi:hypothetical protein